MKRGFNPPQCILPCLAACAVVGALPAATAPAWVSDDWGWVCCMPTLPTGLRVWVQAEPPKRTYAARPQHTAQCPHLRASSVKCQSRGLGPCWPPAAPPPAAAATPARAPPAAPAATGSACWLGRSRRCVREGNCASIAAMACRHRGVQEHRKHLRECVHLLWFAHCL